MDIYYERMFKFEEYTSTNGPIKVRLWVHDKGQEESFFDTLNKIVWEIIQKACYSSQPPFKDLAQQLVVLDSVNAVEVINSRGNGVVLYKDWP